VTTLSIVIPAYNEENGIAAIIERVLAVRPAVAQAGIEGFESACPDAYVRLVAAFEQSVRDGTVPDPSPFDALQSVRIALAIKGSARSGRVVRLNT